MSRAQWRARAAAAAAAEAQRERAAQRPRQRRRLAVAVVALGSVAALVAAALAGVPGAVRILSGLAWLAAAGVAAVLVLVVGVVGVVCCVTARDRRRARAAARAERTSTSASVEETRVPVKRKRDNPRPRRSDQPPSVADAGPASPGPASSHPSAWARFLHTYALHSGDGCDAIDHPRPAAPADLARLEAALGGVALPHELREVLASIDGTSEDDDLFCFDYTLFSAKEMVSEIGTMRGMRNQAALFGGQLAPSEVKTVARWRHAWLPIATDGSGNLLLLDFDPDTAHGGVHGQVVEWYGDTSECHQRATSLAAFIDRRTEGILDGTYVWNDRIGSFSETT